MPATDVWFYAERSGRSPVVEWLSLLKLEDPRGFAKCVALVRRLALEGHDLRRPAAAHLGGGIHELRARRGRVNYRILYFFHGRGVAVLTHALAKEAEVPRGAIERTRERRSTFESNPESHTYWEHPGP